MKRQIDLEVGLFAVFLLAGFGLMALSLYLEHVAAMARCST